MSPRAERLAAALGRHFPDARIRVEDESHQHAGHAGARPDGETHYAVVVVAPAFTGLSRVARSRAAHAAIAEEFETGLHALSLRLLAPGEAGA